MTRLDHHTDRINDIALHYVTAGDRGNDPVILLHGFTQNWYMWSKDVMPALAERYFVVAPDLRGSGDSEKPPSGYDKRTMAADIWALTEHLGLDPILLVGHDFGAAVAYAYAAAHRDHVRRLAIYEMLMPGFGYEDALTHPFAQDGLGRSIWHLAFHDAPYGIPEFLIRGRERAYLDFFWNTFSRDPSAVSEDERRQYARSYEGPSGLNALQYYSTHWIDAEHNRENAKRPLEMPVLAYGGSAFSSSMVQTGMEALAANVEGGIIEDCGHWVTAERPQYIVDQLLEFFGREETLAQQAAVSSAA